MERNMEAVLERLSHWDRKVDFHEPTEITPDIQDYHDYYGFHLDDDIAFHFGKLDIDETKIMVQIYSPEETHGTVFLLHGYLDHVGLLSRIIQFLIEKHYTVISYDLQGHGLSEGETASVEHFSSYVLTLEKLMKKARDEMPLPFYVISHSTGGAIAINYVLKHRNHRFDKVVLAAPLIRSNYWYLTKFGLYLTKPFPFLHEVQRNFRENSSNERYLAFARKDPLQPHTIPLCWFEALVEWNKEIQSYSPTNLETCIIQGDKDETVEWRYNVEFVKEKCHDLQVVHIENGRHELFNETKPIRDRVFSSIGQFLES